MMEAATSPLPKVSVVIPHLNEPDDLRRCLAALKAQEADGIPFEIIVSDNGSHELPEAICADVRLVRELTPGPGPARNLGARMARGDIIAFIDADCLADAGWLRGIVSFFERNPHVGCLAGDVGVARADPDHLTAIEAFESVFSYRVQLYVERHHYAATGNMAVRREVFEAVGPFGGIAVMEDAEWGQRATAQGVTIAYVPEVRVLTPSCRTFPELIRRWDRHIAHEFEKVDGSAFGLAKWIVRSLVMAASPLAEIVTIMRSDKVSGLYERWLAFSCLTRVRFYRAGKMLALCHSGDASRMVGSWNRD
ncbi:glycosyltransferase [Microvirga flavescens]|uniref:glycosyltransferase n=1 Tax=Microvirga flavescens TaxID=2249811 RepID=UPI000DD738C9|nr:glycosyltransferase family A protein [Microvirga flavescens]